MPDDEALAKDADSLSSSLGAGAVPPEPVSRVRTRLESYGERIRDRVNELRSRLQDNAGSFDRDATVVMLERLIHDVANDFADQESRILARGSPDYAGHRCSHDALLSAMQAAKRTALRCGSRADFRVAVDAFAGWLLNHYETSDSSEC